MKNKISMLLLVVVLLQGDIFAQGRRKGGPSGISQGRGSGGSPGGPGRTVSPGGGRGRPTGLGGPSARPTASPSPRTSGAGSRSMGPKIQAPRPSRPAMPTQRPISVRQRPQPSKSIEIKRLRREGPEGIERAPERHQRKAERLEQRQERERRLERIREERPERKSTSPEREKQPEKVAERRQKREERLERIQEGRPEKKPTTPEKEKKVEKRQEEINTFARRQMQQKPELASKIKNAEKTWKRDPAKQRLWRNHWKKFSRYHHFKHFDFDTFIHFVFFAPWHLFPFDFYPTFSYNYPIYWAHAGWLSYPVYWNYGYAHEIRLVEYVQNEDFDRAIDRLEKRLDQLENEVLEQRKDEATLQTRISEIIWLLNDLKKIILDQARISRSEKNRLTIRIDRIKDRAHQLLDHFQNYD